MKRIVLQELKESRPPNCVCCEYMRVCEEDREGQKVDYCPDPNYRKWFYIQGSKKSAKGF